MGTTQVKGGRIKEIEEKIDSIHLLVQEIHERSQYIEEELNELESLKEKVDRLARRRPVRSAGNRRVVMTREREPEPVEESTSLPAILEQVDIGKIAGLLNNPIVQNLLQKIR
ncbi:hypothetical protein [Rubeoparvulum massiliense]|uniref:hypothetical protein n=1 Tax=Rubeoparvulum massiliense TaxID=1631346 RepID=UPI00065E8BCD|nr:hypothetical protein [Rubeoparvulum massiliense]